MAPPFLNDINNFKINFSDIKLKNTKPLSQLEQLLCILPPQSAYLLSNNLKKIILSNNSDIKKLYPKIFEIDYLYKKKYWMTQPKIPTMDIELIKKHFSKIKKNFSEIENELNKKQNLFIYN